MGESAGRHIEPDLDHGRLEQLAVLGRADGLGLGPDELRPETFQHTLLDQAHGQVERRLATERREHGVRPLALDDGGQDVRHQRLDVSAVGELGVGHDGGRVRVGQHDGEPLLLQHPARLGARVVELAGLADDDRTRAQHQDLLQVGAPGH